jgi:intein/homing endonuclease
LAKTDALNSELQLKKEKLELLELQLRLQKGLPHIYAHEGKLYQWQLDFFADTNTNAFLCAANQISKSTTQLRKNIILGTSPEGNKMFNVPSWKELWPSLEPEEAPMFWYLYPGIETLMIEFEAKWRKYLPKNGFENDPKYGWDIKYIRGVPFCLKYNSGFTTYFRTYGMESKNIQATSLHGVQCFTKGHKIETDKGSVNIENIKTGDNVLTRKGFKKVYRTSEKITKIIKLIFNNGTIITCTPEHPFYTREHGFVQAKDLTFHHTLVKVSEWKKKLYLIKKLFCLKENFTQGILIQKIIETKTILGMVKIFTMLRCGKHTIIQKFQKIAAYIIRILTHWITEWQTLSLLHEPNIPDYTKKENGKTKKNFPSNVLFVGKTLFQEQVKKQYLDTVLRNAEKKDMQKPEKKNGLILFLKENVLSVVKCLSLLTNTKVGQPVAKVVQVISCGKEEKVYNISVKECHEYFCNGFLVHNCDEELTPAEKYDELSARMFATGGYFSMVFTATEGQETWRCTMEEKGAKELFKDAFKRSISMYDCMYYSDGTPSMWTEKRINAAKNRCRSEAEIQRRIYGRFVLDSGRIYESFDPKANIVKPYDIPENWFIYAGIDIGGGGPKNHPSAIALVAVRPDFKKAACFMLWRGDEVITTAKDVVEKYISLTKGLDITACYYDWHCKDFETVAISMEVPVYPAEKSHDIGEGLLNVLFKNKMLDIFDTPETYKLTNELIGLKFETVKHKAVDDLCFTAGHHIATNRGLINIEDVRVGHLVWTRKGFKRVTATSIRRAEVSYYKFREGVEFIATPDHNFINRKNEKIKIKDIKSWTELNYLSEFSPLLAYFRLINYERKMDHLVPEFYERTWSDIVYNITVEDEHEYYCNGVLVANCDALRYACAKITFDFSDVDKKVAITVRELTELEQRKRGVLVEVNTRAGLEEEFAEWNDMYEF